eukprot:m.1125248 g.1125248  ORF g.1125248 m.1125248 type:complete len:244 (+) comp24408_c0_seq46:271-1002(+)
MSSSTPQPSCEYNELRNQLQTGMSVFGIIGFFACVVTLGVIFGHRLDRLPTMLGHRYRTIVMLMLSNMVYSVANVIPVWYTRPPTYCEFLLTNVQYCDSRFIWFLGKYWLALNECLVVGFSAYALRCGKTVPWRVEVSLHAAAFLFAVAAAIGWTVPCRDIYDGSGGNKIPTKYGCISCESIPFEETSHLSCMTVHELHGNVMIRVGLHYFLSSCSTARNWIHKRGNHHVPVCPPCILQNPFL